MRCIRLSTVWIFFTDHSIGYDTAWGIGMGREESHGVAGVEDEGLVLLHDGQVVHEKPELSPVGQHLTIATIGHQLLRKLEYI